MNSGNKLKAKQISSENALNRVKEMMSACIQCGTCSSSCPNAFAMEHVPRQLWRLVLDGRNAAVLNSKTYILCSSCYYCTLRCPRGLPITTAMSHLTQIARKENPDLFKQSHAFYDAFLSSVETHGRVNETQFMALYFWEMKSPVLPLKYAALGMKLLAKGRITRPFFALKKRSKKMKKLFDITREMESRP
jgi:heterodisulfide reductase subunit C